MRRFVLASLALGVAVGGLLCLLRLLPDAVSTGDGAIAELYVLHAMRGPWLLGPYSQFYWNHPGPLMFYLLLPFYAAAGGHAVALNAGAAVLNVAAVAWIMRTLQRGGEPAGTFTVAIALALWCLRVPSILDSYWNPMLIALPAVLFAAVSARAASGHGSALVAVVAVGAFLAQSHVGLVPPVAAATAVAFAFGCRPFTRWALVAVALAGVLWAPPAIEELTGAPGNLSTLVRYFAQAPSATRTPLESASIWAGALTAVALPGLAPPIGVPAATTPRPWLIAATFGCLAALALLAWRTRDRPGLSHSAQLTVLISIVALPAIHRSPALVGDYTVFWLTPIGAFAIALLAAWALGRMSEVRHLVPITGVAATILVAALAGRELQRKIAVGSHTPHPLGSVADLDRQLAVALRASGVDDPLVFIDDPVWSDAASTLLQRYKRHERFAVDPAWKFMFGQPLVARGCHNHVIRFAPAASTGPGEVVAQAGGTMIRLLTQPCPNDGAVAH